MEPTKFFDADVIVIGSSIATQSVIHPLLNSNLRILVLEGGDLQRTEFADSLTFSDERGIMWIIIGVDTGLESMVAPHGFGMVIPPH